MAVSFSSEIYSTRSLRQKFFAQQKERKIRVGRKRNETKANDLKWVGEFVSSERECQESYPASNHEELSLRTRKGEKWWWEGDGGRRKRSDSWIPKRSHTQTRKEKKPRALSNLCQSKMVRLERQKKSRTGQKIKIKTLTKEKNDMKSMTGGKRRIKHQA